MWARTLRALGLPVLAASLAALLATTGASAANPGDPFLLGQDNSITGFTTSLSGAVSGPQLKVANASTARTWCCASAISGLLSSSNPGTYSDAVAGINDGTGGPFQTGVYGRQNGSGYGV